MPCNQIILNQVEFKGGTDLALLEAALKAEGYIVRNTGDALYFARSNSYEQGKFEAGLFSVPSGMDTDAIKREYSRQSVLASAKKMGWQVKIDAKDKNKLQIRRRA